MEKEEEEEEEVLCRSFGQFSSSSKMAPLRQSDARSLPFFFSFLSFFFYLLTLYFWDALKIIERRRWRCADDATMYVRKGARAVASIPMISHTRHTTTVGWKDTRGWKDERLKRRKGWRKGAHYWALRVAPAAAAARLVFVSRLVVAVDNQRRASAARYYHSVVCTRCGGGGGGGVKGVTGTKDPKFFNEFLLLDSNEKKKR